MLVSKLFKMEQRKTGKRKTYCWKEEGKTLRKKKKRKRTDGSQTRRQAGRASLCFIVMAMCVILFCRQAFSSFVWLPIELRIRILRHNLKQNQRQNLKLNLSLRHPHSRGINHIFSRTFGGPALTYFHFIFVDFVGNQAQMPTVSLILRRESLGDTRLY